MATLRQFGGISGFPRRAESEYDTFGHGAFVDLDFGRSSACGRGAQSRERAMPSR